MVSGKVSCFNIFYKRPWHIVNTQLTFIDIYYNDMVYEDYNLVWLRKRVQCVCDERGVAAICATSQDQTNQLPNAVDHEMRNVNLTLSVAGVSLL